MSLTSSLIIRDIIARRHADNPPIGQVRSIFAPVHREKKGVRCFSLCANLNLSRTRVVRLNSPGPYTRNA